MSTKPCPQCGSAVPDQARFCGQCGHTFEVASSSPDTPVMARVPKTIDEATQDPSPRAAAPHRGIPTTFGHTLDPSSELTLPAPPAYASHALEEPVTSQRPTPMVPPPSEPGRVLEATIADPDMAGRARHQRDLALAEALARPAGRPPVFGKTLVLGGTTPEAAAAAVAEPTPPMSQRTPPVSAPGQPAPVSQQPASRPNFGSTVALQGGDNRTMLGMPAVALPASSPPVPSPPDPGPPSGLPAIQKTMMGVAIPGIAPTHEPVPAPARMQGTLIGVAAPGIAPTGQAGPAAYVPPPLHAHHAPPPAMPPAPIVPPPAPLVVEPLPEAPRRAQKGVPAVALVGIIFVIVAVIGTGAAFYILRAGAALAATPQLDETGKESLKIRCESCPDGTVVTLGASSTTVKGNSAVLPLPAPLSIGDNDLEMKVDRPAAGRDENVKIHVPVAYRVKADLTTLTASPAAITVRVEAMPGTEVTVDGKPVALDASGRGAHPIPVPEAEGASDETKAFDKKIPFSIASKKDKPETGELAVRAAITPLHLDAPGLELVTDRPTGAVAGQAKPGGTVTIDGQPIVLDAQGRFAVRLELPAEGEKSILIVANAPPLAPRTVRAKITRVAALEGASRALEARTPLAYDTFGANPAANVGKLVVVDGEVLEVRVSQGHSVILASDHKSCASGSCIVRIVHSEETKAARGDTIRAYGRLVGTVSAAGKTVPDVEGTLVLTTATGAKK